MQDDENLCGALKGVLMCYTCYTCYNLMNSMTSKCNSDNSAIDCFKTT